MKRALPLCLFLLLACEGARPDPPPPGPPLPPPPETDAVIFDDSVMHRIEIFVEESYLPLLIPGNDERVPATFTFDGSETLTNIGVRLKRGFASRQDLSGKPGFSIKFNEFVSGQKLFGLKKLILNSEVQDEGRVSRRLGYEIWRLAGVQTPRTAYAAVFFNGEHYGIYTMEEPTNPQYLQRYFAIPTGNLYEGDGRDITNVEEIGLRTNEELNDRSDVELLRDTLLNTPDEQLLAVLSGQLDLEQFVSYWAVELLVDSWDGYAVTRSFDWDPMCCSPNNYYAYHEPGRGFVFLPHGADQLLDDRFSDIRRGPDPEALLATRLFALPEVRGMLAEEISRILDDLWDVEYLIDFLNQSSFLVQEYYTEQSHDTVPFEQLELYRQGRERFLRERPDIVREQLAQGF